MTPIFDVERAAAIADARPLRGREGTLRYVLLDVFTSTPLQGNQLAVFTAAAGISTELMQAIAREMNLSETVFLAPGGEATAVDVRIFTPSAELPFAGHPVLGAAAVLALAGGQRSMVLGTRGGAVEIEVESSEELTVRASMSQPLPTWSDFEEPEALLAALGLERSELPVQEYRNGPRHIYVAAGTPAEVAALSPDLRALVDVVGAAGVSCFASSGDGCKTRMFAPGLGVAEDPATGSAAGPLALHLVRHGRIAFGERIEISQGAEIGRPSRLLAWVQGTRQRIESVHVGGSAVVVGEGRLLSG